MASTDARPVPRKNVAYRATFPIFDADGDLVTGAAGLDSEVSKDAGTFADCTNEATEIATSSGMYYLDLTQTEMNADTVAIIVKTSTSGAKTTALVLYPEELGDFRIDPQTIWDALTAALTTANSIGKLLVDNINATISSRLASAGYTAPDNATIAAIDAKTTNLPAAPAATGDIPTADQNAAALLKLDWTTVTGEAARSCLNAFRLLRNKWAVSAGTLSVKKEDDSTEAWSAAVSSDAAAEPITGSDPA